MIRVYQAAFSPLQPASCRYTPTCSEYALTAVRRFGALRGGWMALRRLLRCHPFGGRGYDPVPREPGGEEAVGNTVVGEATVAGTAPGEGLPRCVDPGEANALEREAAG